MFEALIQANGGKSGMAHVAFAIPLLLVICNAIPLLAHAIHDNNSQCISATPRLTFHTNVGDSFLQLISDDLIQLPSSLYKENGAYTTPFVLSVSIEDP